jgi:hypothetical protein
MELTRLRQAIGQSEAPRALPGAESGRTTAETTTTQASAQPEENR